MSTTAFQSADEALSVIRQRQTIISQMETEIANLSSALFKLKLEQRSEMETWKRKHFDTLNTNNSKE